MRQVLRQYPAQRDDIADLVTRRPLPGAGLPQVDPFLFLNHHGPQTYRPGNSGLPFGPHPHRGFETVSFILEGEMAHLDSGGHESVIRAGRRPVDDRRLGPDPCGNLAGVLQARRRSAGDPATLGQSPQPPQDDQARLYRPPARGHSRDPGRGRHREPDLRHVCRTTGPDRIADRRCDDDRSNSKPAPRSTCQPQPAARSSSTSSPAPPRPTARRSSRTTSPRSAARATRSLSRPKPPPRSSTATPTRSASPSSPTARSS